MFRHVNRVVVLLSVAATLALGAARGALAQRAAAPATAARLDATLPFDPAVRTATLPNGLRYFVRQNARPEKRVSLRLAVKAGSLDEADDQQGLAHFVEHMAFNGSTHFKPGEIFSYFESIGARLGPHVNAYTSFDQTVYMLDLPTDKPEIVTRGLEALADFAGGLAFDPQQVDRERGVVVEEWRGRLGAASRVRDKQIPILYYHSRYADRIPIGKPEVIRNAPSARLRAFYDAWYRPERMAVVAVGDIDPAGLETALKAAFGPIAARAPAVPRPDASVPLHKDTLVSVVTDSEVTRSSVQMVRKRPKEGEQRVGDYRRDLAERLLEQMFNERFSELARRPDAKFLGAGVSDNPLSPQVAGFTIAAGVQEGAIEEGAAAIAVEARRVREHGFSETELERAKRWMSAFYERAYSERDKSESGSFAQEYVTYFLEEEPAPGIAYEYGLVKELLPGITAAEVSAMARQLMADDSRVVLAVAPEKAGGRVPSEAALLAAFGSADKMAVTAWNDSASGRALMERKPQPGVVTGRRTIDALGVTIVRFANGVEAWLKPTDFKNDQVLFTMDALGGASLAPADEYLNASFAPSYVGLSGAGGLKSVDLQKLLAGKLASASPFVGLSTHGLSGSAAPAELETALQLLYLQFTVPGDDPDAFGLMKRQLEAAVSNREQDPDRAFRERLAAVNTSNHYTALPITTERIASLDRAKMMAFYRERFANAADFTLFMVGAFKIDDAVALLAQYVGSLPSSAAPASRFKDVGVRFPDSVARVRVEKGREPRSQTVMSFFADPAPDPVEQENISAATTVLEIALRDILREELGQTYGVSVGLSQRLPQRGDGHTEVQFGSAPENVDAMTDRVLKEIRRLQEEGPSADLTNRAKQTASRGYETSLKQNQFWLRRLDSAHLIGSDPEEILRRPQRIDAVTPQVLREVFRRYFPLARSTIVTLVPAPG